MSRTFLNHHGVLKNRRISDGNKLDYIFTISLYSRVFLLCGKNKKKKEFPTGESNPHLLLERQTS